MFLKDMLFLLLAYLVILMFSFVGELNLHMAVVLLLMYAGYILLVIVMELRQRDKNMRRIVSPIIHNVAPKPDESTMGIEFQERAVISQPAEESGKFYDKSQQFEYANKAKYNPHSKLLEDEHINTGELKQLMGLAEYHSTELSKLRYGIQWRLFKVRLLVYDSVRNEEWKEMKWYSRILYIPIGAIFTALMRMSIPPTDDQSWDRRFASIFPIFSFGLIVWQFRLYESPMVLIVGFVFAAVLALFIYCSTHRTDPPAVMLVRLVFYMHSNVAVLRTGVCDVAHLALHSCQHRH